MRGRAFLYLPFRKRLDAFTGQLTGVGKGDVEAIHRARVASRRLREILPLMELPHDVALELVRRLRKATRQLGIVRELDVQYLLVKDLAKDRRCSRAALRQLAARVNDARASAREHLSVKFPVSKLERLARRLRRATKDLKPDTTKLRAGPASPPRASVWALEARLGKRAARVRKEVADAPTFYVPEQLHGARLAVKKLRYATELLADVREQPVADIARLKAAQDLLGGLHDAEMLLVLVRETQASAALPDLTGWRDLDSVVHVLEERCRRLHARFGRDRARLITIADRIGAGATDIEIPTRRAVG
jgi:CHAD domain-containing protein